MSKNTSTDTQDLPSSAMFDANPYKRPRIVLQEDRNDALPPRPSSRLGTSAEKVPLPRSPTHGLSPNTREGRERPMSSSSYDLPMRHRDIQEAHMSSSHPTIVQRRGYPASGRAPALYLSEKDRDSGSIPVDTEPSIQSAPPQQHHFSSEVRLPPPSHLLSASDHARYDAQPRHPQAPPPTAPEMQGYGPPPGGASRVYMAPHMSLPSPAYATNLSSGYQRRSFEAGRALDACQGAEGLHNSAPNKANFLSLFSSFYDSLLDSRALKTTLEHQINASNAILQTLQRSSHVLEEAVEQRVLQCTQQWECRLSQIEDRLTRIEAHLSQPSDQKPEA